MQTFESGAYGVNAPETLSNITSYILSSPTAPT